MARYIERRAFEADCIFPPSTPRSYFILAHDGQEAESDQLLVTFSPVTAIFRR